MLFSPEAILDILKIYLPRLTDLFSTNTPVTAEIIDGTPQTLRIIKASHGLSPGDEIVTIDGIIDNSITAVQDVGGGILRFITNTEHDLTFGETLSVDLSGFTDSGLNNTFSLASVPSRNIFEIEYPTLPTLNGNEILREDWSNGINGIFTIDSVTVSSFDILLTGKPTFQPGVVNGLKVVDSYRMSIAADFNRALDMYTETNSNQNWLFVIMNESSANKDRNNESDAIATNTSQNSQRIKMINTFSINTIITTVNDIAGADASQKSWTDILVYFMSVISGKTFETFGNSNFVVTMINHGQADYRKGFYAHNYSFEYVYEITDVETFTQKYIVSRAFRDNKISFAEIQDGSNINLDDE